MTVFLSSQARYFILRNRARASRGVAHALDPVREGDVGGKGASIQELAHILEGDR